jgi:hypothetical protein
MAVGAGVVRGDAADVVFRVVVVVVVVVVVAVAVAAVVILSME